MGAKLQQGFRVPQPPLSPQGPLFWLAPSPSMPPTANCDDLVPKAAPQQGPSPPLEPPGSGVLSGSLRPLGAGARAAGPRTGRMTAGRKPPARCCLRLAPCQRGHSRRGSQPHCRAPPGPGGAGNSGPAAPPQCEGGAGLGGGGMLRGWRSERLPLPGARAEACPWLPGSVGQGMPAALEGRGRPHPRGCGWHRDRAPIPRPPPPSPPLAAPRRQPGSAALGGPPSRLAAAPDAPSRSSGASRRPRGKVRPRSGDKGRAGAGARGPGRRPEERPPRSDLHKLYCLMVAVMAW